MIPEFNQYLVDFDYPIAIAAFVTLILSTVVLSFSLKRSIAFALATIKIAIVVIYFTSFTDGTWFFGGDDYGYLERGAALAATGRNPFTIWFHPEAYYLKQLSSISLMYYYNYLAIYFFGFYYHSPVLLNVLLSCISAILYAKCLQPFKLNKNYETYFVVFYSLHWTTLVWHSFLNIKEPLVIVLVALALYFLSIFSRHPARAILGLLGTIFLFLRCRFYFPGILVFGVFLSSVNVFFTTRYRIFLTLLILLSFVYIFTPEIRLFFRFAEFLSAPYGTIHFLLQPLPWRITEPASYLLIPAWLHWIALPATILGGYKIWKLHITGRIIVGSIITGILFYGLVPLIASTRHRAPLDSLMIICQFHFLWLYAWFWMHPNDKLPTSST